jgi:hypothetical protein
MIQTMPIAAAFAVPDPKHIILNDNVATVYSGGDIPPAPPAPRTITAWEFRDRFLTSEIDAILDLAYAGNAQARRLILKLQTATGGVDLDSDVVIAGVDFLVAQAILTPARKAEILA